MKRGLEEPKTLKRIHNLAIPRRLSHPSSSTLTKSSTSSKTISGINGGLQVIVVLEYVKLITQLYRKVSGATS